MIQEFVDIFMEKKDSLQESFKVRPPLNYKDLVVRTVEILRDEDYYPNPDPSRVHQIDDGDYQGTLVFVIGAENYQPNIYWVVKVAYGSCSGCDTLERIKKCSDTPAEDFTTLALHIVQQLKEI